MKRCTKCGEEKPLEEFSKRKNGLQSHCKACFRAYCKMNREKITEQQRAYHEANRERVAEQQRAYRRANREKLAEQRRAHYEANRERVAEQQRTYRRANREKIAEQARLRRYKITPEQWKDMLAAQGNACAICQQPGKLVADHCHTSGAPRGALCATCNGGLGMFKDQPDLLLRAAAYLTAS